MRERGVRPVRGALNAVREPGVSQAPVVRLGLGALHLYWTRRLTVSPSSMASGGSAPSTRRPRRCGGVIPRGAGGPQHPGGAARVRRNHPAQLPAPRAGRQDAADLAGATLRPAAGCRQPCRCPTGCCRCISGWPTCTPPPPNRSAPARRNEKAGAENQQAAGSAASVAEALSREADAGRLRFLAAVSEALIGTPDTAESAGKLVELVVPRLGDGAIVSAVGDDGQSGQESHHHRDPAPGADLDGYLAGRIRGTGNDSPMVEGAAVRGAGPEPRFMLIDRRCGSAVHARSPTRSGCSGGCLSAPTPRHLGRPRPGFPPFRGRPARGRSP